jgi:hypothetical protein
MEMSQKDIHDFATLGGKAFFSAVNIIDWPTRRDPETENI